MSLLKATFRYTDSERTKKPGYLANKWDRLYPGWRRPKKLEPVVQIGKRKAA